MFKLHQDYTCQFFVFTTLSAKNNKSFQKKGNNPSLPQKRKPITYYILLVLSLVSYPQFKWELVEKVDYTGLKKI